MKNHRKTGMEKEETACRFLLTQGIHKTAEYYLFCRGMFDRPARFDVVEIIGKKIRVIKNAF